ncbi:MAG: hypothetical protein HQL82_15425 [Magnetococcales bacterium]|nr:hypothetical protein [Magnetococcales bacterium]
MHPFLKLATAAGRLALQAGALKAAAELKERLPLRLAARTGELSLAPTLVRRAAAAVMERTEGIDGWEFGVQADHFILTVQAHKGPRVTLRLVPEAVLVNNQRAEILCRIPGGLKDGATLDHNSRALVLAARLFDTLFGILEKQLTRLEGLTLEGDLLRYTHPIGEAGLFSLLAQRLLPTEEFRIPLEVREDWLVIRWGALWERVAAIPGRLWERLVGSGPPEP